TRAAEARAESGCAARRSAQGPPEEEGRPAVTEGDVVVEATGETVGEAKWAALRELELRHPGVDKSAARFEVVTEGERGLLGVGYSPARVLAQLPAESATTVAFEGSELASDMRDLVHRVIAAL